MVNRYSTELETFRDDWGPYVLHSDYAALLEAAKLIVEYAELQKIACRATNCFCTGSCRPRDRERIYAAINANPIAKALLESTTDSTRPKEKDNA